MKTYTYKCITFKIKSFSRLKQKQNSNVYSSVSRISEHA